MNASQLTATVTDLDTGTAQIVEFIDAGEWLAQTAEVAPEDDFFAIFAECDRAEQERRDAMTPAERAATDWINARFPLVNTTLVPGVATFREGCRRCGSSGYYSRDSRCPAGGVCYACEGRGGSNRQMLVADFVVMAKRRKSLIVLDRVAL